MDECPVDYKDSDVHEETHFEQYVSYGESWLTLIFLFTFPAANHTHAYHHSGDL